MLKQKFGLILWFLLRASFLSAQSDTLEGKGEEEVLVTATRTERKLSHAAVPAFLIQKSQIAATQLRRLQEILQEQTGLVISGGSGTGSFGGGLFGNGVQIQGLSPEYTLVLINGEPLIGRQGGVVNLARLPLGGIKKIEVVKGPAGSLYGSEAIGGVINIITELPSVNSLDGRMQFGNRGLFDGTLNGAFAKGATKGFVTANHHRMAGIPFPDGRFSRQQDPFSNQSIQAQISHSFNSRTMLRLFARWFGERSDNQYEVTGEGLETLRIGGNTRIQDGSLNATLQWRVSPRVHSYWRLYGTAYQSVQALQVLTDKRPYYFDDFRQQFYRAENQTDWRLSEKANLTAGGGHVLERLNTNRYAGIRTNGISYLFLQHQWKPSGKAEIISGLRYDHNQAYASRLSPKLAIRFNPGKKWTFKASYGAGFKAPDFRQLYLSFVNNAAAGYALFGANEISLPKLEQMKREGFISTILDRAGNLSQLKPETSHGINLGTSWQMNPKLQLSTNLFYNALSNQIVFDAIALRPGGSQVFSYFNVARSFTGGGEVDASWQLTPAVTFSGGYQLLYSGDLDVLKQIRAGALFGRDEQTNNLYSVTSSDYAGLPGRSRHQAQLKCFYNGRDGWQWSVRAMYRSRWGTFDRDGNGIINRRDETASSYCLLNINVSKQWGSRLQTALGAENLLNHRDPVYLPNIPGIQFWASMAYAFVKSQKKQI